MADKQPKGIKGERGGSSPPTSDARNPIASNLARDSGALPRDRAGKTPGSAELGALDGAQLGGPGKTPGNAEG
jgi:hypothetical protein